MRTMYLYCYDCQTQESFLDEVDEREIKEGITDYCCGNCNSDDVEVE